MKKINIVKENKDFDRIIQNKKPFRYHNFLLFVEKSSENYKFGISVSKKTCNAVGRNIIKRQIRSIIDHQKYIQKFNCIIIANKKIVNDDYQTMERDLIYCLKKLNLIGDENEEKNN